MTPAHLNCADLRQLLDSYVSGELLVETNLAVDAHLAACAACAAEFARRKALRAALRDTLGGPVAAEGLEQRIREAIAADAGRGRRFPVPMPWLAATAAGLAIALGGFWLARDRAQPAARQAASAVARSAVTPVVDRTAYEDLVQTHIYCALGRTYGMAPTDDEIRERLGPYAGVLRASGLQHEGWSLVDAHICPNGDRRLGHVILRKDGHILSLVIAPRNRGDLPEAALTVDAADTPLGISAQEDYELTGLSTPRHVAFVISDFPVASHIALSRDVAPRVAAFLKSQEDPFEQP